ncbi:MAG: fatty acid alpha-hydroxylase [Trizodia sp. TS-e1964]|nr:MAG: fatty acid alpha-hydroxylase [Trizodia sp. TS-e1964]
MPGRTLPSIRQSDLQKHSTAKSCYVTVGTKVYDITDFLDDHPGGPELILEYGGKEVGQIMGDEISHAHGDAAYEILDEHLIGFLASEKVVGKGAGSQDPDAALPKPSLKADKPILSSNPALNADGSHKVVYATTGMSSAADLSVVTDASADFRTHQFLDLNRPLLMQVWNGGFSKKFYLEQVHRPRHYKGGESAPLFGNFLEPLGKTPWWVVPLIWLPPVMYGTYISREGLSSWMSVASHWLFGLALWTLVEYTLHRCLFHVDRVLPDNRVGITLHFLVHGIHHYLPMDKLRLVMPPALFTILATPFYHLVHLVMYWNWHAATALFSGGIFGYICYDLTHYFLHHRTLPAYYRDLKKYHLQHHFADFENGFGVTSRFWDRVFGTELAPPQPLKGS